jgi:hypothetical protein
LACRWCPQGLVVVGLGIVAIIIVVGAANKALILRNEHNIKMIHGLVVEVVIILGINTLMV